jgi:hypothetical protein
MKTNEELQKDVQNALKWEPLVSTAEIGVQPMTKWARHGLKEPRQKDVAAPKK